jgi:hypothetical protein
MGRLEHRDVREATIDDLGRRYRVDDAQARRVAASAGRLLGQVTDAWDLGDQHYAHLLEWAARLHEIGLDIAHSGYHRHGAYVLRYADLPGFSHQEQAEVAALVHVHRRKFDAKRLDDLPRRHRKRLLLLAVLLRIAVVLHRGRHDVDLGGRGRTAPGLSHWLVAGASAHRSRSGPGKELPEDGEHRPGIRLTDYRPRPHCHSSAVALEQRFVAWFHGCERGSGARHLPTPPAQPSRHAAERGLSASK